MSNIVKLAEGPVLADVPGQLHALADRIDAGEYGDVAATVTVVLSDGPKYHVLGHGMADGLMGTAILAQGLHNLLAMNS